jgi:hypothetical protein
MSSSTSGIHDAADANNCSYVTYGNKSSAKTKDMTCKQYKQNISVFICDIESIKDNQIHEGDLHEAELRFNKETYTPSVGAAGMLLHINGKITT